MQASGNDFWDDPEWQELRSRVSGNTPKLKNKSRARLKHKAVGDDKTQQNKKLQKNPRQAEPREISIRLTLPQIRTPKIPSFRNVGRINRMQLTIVLLAVGVLGIFILGSIIRRTTGKQAGNSTGVLSGMAQEPDFETLLPEGNLDNTDSGKVGYDTQKRVASFTDRIGHVELTVSQQPLPEGFKSNPDEEVKKLAQSFSANEVIVESNPKAYLGTSQKGPQTAILHKKGLLIFIYANSTLDKDDWAVYITKLL